MSEQTVQLPPDTLQPEVRAELISRIEARGLKLPLLPEVAAQVIQMTQREDSDCFQLAELLYRDAAMTGHVLRVANSPLYAPAVPIESLQQATSRLGMKKISEIALMISCKTRVFQTKAFGNQVKAMFAHALASAAFAQDIGKMRNRSTQETFLCGLLHDIGRPVLLQELVDIASEQNVSLSYPAVHAVLDEFHALVGSQLIQTWALSKRLVEAILHHHDPETAPKCAALAKIARLASDFAHHIVGPRAVEEDDLRGHAFIKPDEVEPLLERREPILEAVRSLS